MSSQLVQKILHEIESLADDERVILEQRLSELAQAEWDRETRDARQQARQRGIDQAAIDRAIERRRYGR